MQLWQSILLLVIWEVVQLAITAVFGRLFWSSNKTNAYLEREEHLPTSEVVHPMTADEVTLSWDDLHSVVEDSGGGGRTNEAANASLLTWQEGTLVPPPPAPPPMIAVFGMGGGGRQRRNRTGPAATATATGSAVTATRATPVQGVPVASATVARPGGAVTDGHAIEMGSVAPAHAAVTATFGNSSRNMSRNSSPREGVNV